MGGRGWAVLLGVVASLGCGLVDRDEQGLGGSFCAVTAAGKPTYFVRTWQENPDGTTRSAVVVFSAEGKLRKTSDFGDDGSVDQTIVYTLDEHGNVIREELDSDADGVLDQLTVSEYDESNQPLSMKIDEGADGEFDYAMSWVYQVIPRVLEITDEDADGIPDSTYAAHYTHEGDLTWEEWDRDADGVVDDRTIYSYREEDGVDYYLTDRGGDGTTDAVRRITWDLASITTWASVSIDTDGDGTWERVTRYVRDERGVLLRIDTDLGDDGTVDEVIRYSDGPGPRTNRVDYEYADGSGYAYEYEYREGGGLVETRLDSDGDGSWDMIETRTDCPG